MVVEAADTNWYDATASTKYPTTIFLRRLGARHGKRSLDGANADTNFCFFDGHVAAYNTSLFEAPANSIQNFTHNTIFYLNAAAGH